MTNQQKLGVKVFIYSDVETKYLDMYVAKFKRFKPDFVATTEQAGVAKVFTPGATTTEIVEWVRANVADTTGVEA